jgi:tyrosyl-tRNA synthetase
MLERDDFAKRYSQRQSIGIHEFLYPLVQAYDSVALQCDVELGGTDQRFNLLLGREVQRAWGGDPQVIVTMPLLEGTDGRQKMSKSLGNAIGVADPPDEVFGKVMSISDDLMLRYAELLLPQEFSSLRTEIAEGVAHPMSAKKQLARALVTKFHGAAAGDRACGEFERRFQKKQLPERLPQYVWPERPQGRPLLAVVMKQCGLSPSTTQGRRLIVQGAVRVDGGRVSDPNYLLDPSTGQVLVQVGSRRVCMILFPSPPD